MTRWWWLRHGPVPGNRISGRLDVDCEPGDVGTLAASLPRDGVLVESGWKRCRQTAEALGLARPIVEPDFAEQDFGAWQGKSWDEVDAGDFWRDPAGTAPPSGESFAQVCARVAAAILRFDPSGDVIAVAHAGSIRAALALALDLTPSAALRIEVAPLSLTRIDRLDGGWRVGCVNRTC